VLWRAGLRINEALSLTETDLDQQRGVDPGSGTERAIAGAWSVLTLGMVRVAAMAG
jgi:hypothetical protein